MYVLPRSESIRPSGGLCDPSVSIQDQSARHSRLLRLGPMILAEVPQPPRGRAGLVRGRRLPPVRGQRPCRRPDLFRPPASGARRRSTAATGAPTPATYVFKPDPASSPCWCRHGTKRRSSPRCCKATLKRLDYDNYRIFVGHYRNDPATAAAIASVADPRIESVEVAADGPTTKADCLNHLYDALVAYELANDCEAKAVVLHDAEDVVHRYELRIFDGLIDRAAVIQLPGPAADRPAVALDRRPLLRRVRRSAHQGAGRSRGGRRRDPAGRRRLRDRAARARPARRACRTASRSRAPA